MSPFHSFLALFALVLLVGALLFSRLYRTSDGLMNQIASAFSQDAKDLDIDTAN